MKRTDARSGSSTAPLPHDDAKASAAAQPGSPYEAHPFQPSADDPESPRCALCGELRIQIRHHPTRIAAARRLKGLEGLDPKTATSTRSR